MENFDDSEAVVCQLCREPIWNFLCIDCLGENVKKWLPNAFGQQFSRFHQSLKSHFHTFIANNYEPCLDCNMLNETPICPHCYTHEAYHWISTINPDIAARFGKIFFFYPFEGSEFVKSESQPIDWNRSPNSGPGMCDNCGEYSENLELEENGWCCEVCKD